MAKIRKPSKRKDAYRAGDLDFERRRDRFYAGCHYEFNEPPPLVVPLAAIYAFDPETTKRRAEFYANCSRVFGWGWALDVPDYQAPRSNPGREGQHYDRVKISTAKDESRNDATDVLTWLATKGKLNSEIEPPRTDRKLEIAWSEGRERQNTASKLQEVFQKAELTPLRSADPAAIGGGGSFGSRFVAVSKIEAMRAIQDLRNDIPQPCMAMLERILVGNRLDRTKGAAAERMLFNQVRMSIDFATWSMDRSRPDIDPYDKASAELCRRWPDAWEWITVRRLRRGGVMAKRITRSRRSF